MRTYRRTLQAGVALFLLYLALAVLSPLHLIERQEVFPFFSWSLFSSPKKLVTMYSVLIEKDGGAATVATPPPRFESAGGYARLLDSPLATHIGLVKVLATFSREAGAPNANVQAIFAAYRPQVDSVLRKQAVRYHLFRTQYDPIELFRERRYRDARYVATFELRDGPNATHAGDPQ